MSIPSTKESEFARAAVDPSGANIFGDFWSYLRSSKKWWLLPILMVLMMLGLLVLLSGSAAAPFIYTLF